MSIVKATSGCNRRRCCNETPSTAEQNHDILTCTLSKSYFQKNSVMQYTPSTLIAIQFSQHTLAMNKHVSRSILLKLCMLQQKNNFAYSSIVGVKNIKISSGVEFRFHLRESKFCVLVVFTT